MKHQHCDPSEAVQIHLDVGSKSSLGVHWGTFMMSDEYYLDPPRLFEKARIERKLPKDAIYTSRLGEVVVICDAIEEARNEIN